MIARPVLNHRALEVAQPEAERQTQFCKSVFPDVDMCSFLDRKPQTRRAVFENYRRDPEGRLAVENARNVEPLPTASTENALLRRNRAVLVAREEPISVTTKTRSLT